jgi:allophanate hydrolase
MMTTTQIPNLVVSELLAAYQQGHTTPHDVLTQLLKRIDSAPEHHVWITRLTAEQVFEYVRALEDKSPQELPLYGVPFVIKDNIDLAGIPTTAACPAFAYTPAHSATVVQKLIAAGAIPLGKANMDQFATGLVGTRSPYGAGRNAFNPEYVSGGSSSGSALVVALGFASFALGTDTAGSGRVPAAFNNLIGLKPSCGRLSTQGLVPACRSIDCISIFALTAGDAAQVLRVAEGYDVADAYSQPVRTAIHSGRILNSHVVNGANTLCIGVPYQDQLQFFGDIEYQRLFNAACEQVVALGAELVEVDFTNLFAAARLLYEGPWVAERYAAIEALIESDPDALHPVTREITLPARGRTAIETFKAQYRLQALRRASEAVLAQADVFMTPTAATVYRIDEVLANPLQLNSNLGVYTNFMNLLDLAAVALPAGFRNDGLPFGVTLFAQRDTDEALLILADRLHRGMSRPDADGVQLGATRWTLPTTPLQVMPQGYSPIAVCGAHMQGLPLNHQLTSRGAFLISRTTTTENYRFYALPGGPPFRPGLVRVNETGYRIEVEVWALPQSQWGTFIAGIPAPLCLGQVELHDGQRVTGFLCEGNAVQGARDISAFSGWRAYLGAQ